MKDLTKILLIDVPESDLVEVLKSCEANVCSMTANQAIYNDISNFDGYYVFANYKPIDVRLRVKLELEVANGKNLFLEAIASWGGVYCAPPKDTVRSRLIVASDCIPGLAKGELLDDESNLLMRPWYDLPETVRPLLVYRERIIAHDRLNEDQMEDMIKGGSMGLCMMSENVMAGLFVLHNFNRARFAPRKSWQHVIEFIAEWLTESLPSYMPEPVVSHRTGYDLTDDAVFEKERNETISLGVGWLKGLLVDEGNGGIREGLSHNINFNGVQNIAKCVRTDCVGEAAGAFRFFGILHDNKDALETAERLERLVFGPMQIRGGLLDGMIRWTDSAWEICYQDDVARAILPTLYACLFLGREEYLSNVCSALDFLVKTTAKDGCRVFRTDGPNLNEEEIKKLSEAEHGYPSAHYNAYYHAALLMAYKCSKKEIYLEVARKGIEYIMNLYPDTCREQSETEELCRLILPLSLLYGVTKDEKHRAMLYRVTHDLVSHRHKSGGYMEWDTGYTATCSRESKGECSLLTENGDPIADLLYSVNWLPIGFAMAYDATGDKLFYELWRGIAEFFIKTQVISQSDALNGSWCRAFDMERNEVYGCPHDVGWAANCSESGWTVAEILMGLMLPDILSNQKKNNG